MLRLLVPLLFLSAAEALKSTVKCEGETAATRTCAFENVCYRSGHWWSYGDGVLLDTVEVTLGTYDAHGKLQVLGSNLAVPQPVGDGGDEGRCQWVDVPVFYYEAPQSMYYHWLVDDMLGLWWLTQRRYGAASDDNIVLLTDTSFHGLTPRMPSLFSRRPFAKLDDDAGPFPKGVCTCVREMYAGPAGYQLGGPGIFRVSDGDLFAFRHFVQERVKSTASQQHAAAEFVLDSADLPMTTTASTAATAPNPLEYDYEHRDGHCYGKMCVLVLRRSKDRLIVNEDELVARLRALPGVDVTVVQLESFSYAEQLALLARTDVLVGAHGSGLANLMFLPRKAGLVEIFPYVFSRPTYGVLAKRFGLGYTSWTNTDKDKAVFHEEILNGAAPNLKELIIRDPDSRHNSWLSNLYWVNQDTIVDVEAIAQAVQAQVKSTHTRRAQRSLL